MPNTYTELNVHLVFATKGRLPVRSENIRHRLHAYLGGVAKSLGSIPLAINGPDDHVHLLVCYPSRLPIADLVMKLKANSSKWLHETWPDLAALSWQSGYAAFSVSRSRIPVVTRYIRRQEEHHRSRTLEEELRWLVGRRTESVAPDGAPDSTGGASGSRG